jgi:hypothetical protein
VERWHLPDYIGRTMRSLVLSDSGADEDYDINILRSSIQWLNELSGTTFDEPRLRQNELLLKIPGLNSEALDLIEEKFMGQSEELYSLASQL